jgi:SAM-dependent methyltransferase
MSYTGLTEAVSQNAVHLGGNLLEGDPYSYSPSVWDYLIKRFSPNSLLDLGSGLGHAATYFHSAGLKVLAVDGLNENCSRAIFPTVQVDLTKNKVITKVDLVHCQEVVEHIEEVYLDNLLSSLACGRVIVITHAFPGQGGHHHVNCQPPEYWIDNLRRYNCELLVEDTKRLKSLAQLDGATYLSTSGMIFSNKARF